jgi:hypothetical protein
MNGLLSNLPIIGSYFSSDTTTPGSGAPGSSAPASSPSGPGISTSGQKNKSEFPMPNHPKAQEHFDEVRAKVKDEYAEEPAVLALSDKMGASRQKHSAEHPKASDKSVIHKMQKSDSFDQFEASASGSLTPQLATQVPASSVPAFVDSLLDKDKQPETLEQASDAVQAAAVGFTGQMLFGHAPGNPFTGE